MALTSRRARAMESRTLTHHPAIRLNRERLYLSDMRFPNWLVVLTWLVMLCGAVACNAPMSASSAPVKLADGQPTFVFVYTSW